jgi:hypothetical protein
MADERGRDGPTDGPTVQQEEISCLWHRPEATQEGTDQTSVYRGMMLYGTLNT